MKLLLIGLCLVPLFVFAQNPEADIARLKSATETEKISLYTHISAAYAESQPDLAVHYANEGMRLAERKNDQPGQAALLLQLGKINSLHRHHDLARRFFNEALGIYRRLQDAEGIARSYDELGLLDGEGRDSAASSGDFKHALQFYRDSHDSSGVIETYERMGRTLADQGEHDKALSYYLRALTQYEHRGQKPEAYFVLLQNISHLYLEKGDSSAAMHYLNEGLKGSRKEALRDTEVHLLNAEGEVLEKENKDVKALSVYKQALAEAKQYHDPAEEAQALIHIADILKTQNTSSSLSDLKEALGIARQLGQPKLEARIYEAMAGIYQQEKNYREAMTALEEQHRLLDSVMNANTAKDIAELDSSYALESSREKVGDLQHINKVEKNELGLSVVAIVAVVIIAVLLLLYLRKVKQLNEELKNSNRVKDTLFSVIGHDLKGPAGSAAQLFELMDTEDLPADEMKLMIGELRKQTAASLELLQALFEWGKAQLQGIKVQPVDFNPQPVVERCIDLLGQQAALKNISIKNQLPDYLNLHADANHFEFIIRNLLSNAIKFSHEGGAIEVGVEIPPKKKEAIFSVRDQGVGISKAQQAIFLSGNLKVNFGTQKEKGSGLGLLLTKDFIKANHGRIWLESEEGKGSTFFVAMPTIYAN